MRVRTLYVLGWAALTVTAIAQKSPEQANSTRSEEAWRNLQDLRQKVEEKAPSGVNSIEFHAGREKALHDAAAAFVKDFPNEPQEPQALIWKLQMSDFPASTDERIKLLNRNEQDAKAVIDNETIPANLRFEAERTILDQWLDNPELVATVGQAAELDRRIESYLQKNPAESRIRSFQLARAGLLIRVDKQKGITFLEQLSLNSEPKLASSAKAQLEKVQLVGKPLELTFTTTKGDKLDLQTDYHGKVVLIDFWASWCPDCIRELPTVQEVYGKYKDEGFAVIGISLDKDAKALSNFVCKKSIPWPQYFDGKGWDNELSTKYGISEIPEMWLIDKEGHLVSTQITMGQLNDRVAELLNSSGKVSAE